MGSIRCPPRGDADGAGLLVGRALVVGDGRTHAGGEPVGEVAEEESSAVDDQQSLVEEDGLHSGVDWIIASEYLPRICVKSNHGETARLCCLKNRIDIGCDPTEQERVVESPQEARRVADRPAGE
jgi:hypothetical protein